MEETNETHLEEMLTCPVCRDIFNDPRQLPCGHSVCMGCLEKMVDRSSELPFRCPDCRGQFGSVLWVQKSFALASIAEEVRANKARKEQQKKVLHCDLCTDRKTPARWSCLKCEVSMCAVHAEDHHNLPVYSGHIMVSPLTDMFMRKCPQHQDKVLRYYCSASGRYICNICAFEKKLFNQETEASTVLRRQLTEHMDQRFRGLEEQMKASKEMIRGLRQERKKVNSDIWPLNSVTVVVLFLWFIVLYYAYIYSVENQALTGELQRQHSRVAELLLDHPMMNPHPATENSEVLALDLDSTSPFLEVSADLRTAKRVKTKLNYVDRSGRFDVAPQVLSAHCFSTGVHAWEVEVEGYWDIAVSYKSIQRKSKHSSAFGKNAESWSLTHNGKGELFLYHNKEKTVLPDILRSSRIVVSVDFEDGSINFSVVESTIKHLHQFKAKLTEPVCLGLGLYRVDPPSKASIIKVS